MPRISKRLGFKSGLRKAQTLLRAREVSWFPSFQLFTDQNSPAAVTRNVLRRVLALDILMAQEAERLIDIVDDDSALGSSTSTDTETLRTSLRQSVWENGRAYHR